jgi:hypothetical protein
VAVNLARRLQNGRHQAVWVNKQDQSGDSNISRDIKHDQSGDTNKSRDIQKRTIM